MIRVFREGKKVGEIEILQGKSNYWLVEEPEEPEPIIIYFLKIKMVGWDGIEPPTHAFSGHCSTD